MKTSCSDSCLSSAVSGAILSDEHVVRLRDCQAPLLLLLRLCVARCPERGAPCQEPCGGGVCVCDASWGLAGLEGPQVPPNSLSLPRAVPKLPGSSMLVPGTIQCAH